MERIFVTGIDTGIGKTIISAILVEKLQADYWKPVQSGELDDSDTKKVSSLVMNARSRFHREAYRLTQPLSPHQSAKLDGVEIRLSDIKLPETDNTLVIEGAGGLMVPLNDKELMIDLIRKLEAKVVLVSKNYLGSINHTLLSAGMLKKKGLPVLGIVFNGLENPASEEAILGFSGFKLLGHIPEAEKLNAGFISECTGLINLGK